MQLFVKTLSGKSLCLEANASDTVESLKHQIQLQSGLDADSFRLLSGGRSLEEEAVVGDSLDADSTLHLVVNLLGGGKKKKKKIFTKPKKNKHKKKKVPLAVLKFYKVDDNGTITRTRMECPHPDCGAGVFMAAHKDRQYCGKCGLTYVFQQE
eukprot:TRINITY_DN9207_c0_g1_i1.p2 TRINITY_DN9207_c0_g1~~TRINITY_DN9207_c0_g1_i1.p2  ORF type:complete len:153 (+),score=46.76 TRINITY_DN9207_c0_g1_i1:82-540(+)